jgi:flagellar basal body-associated protein FliL
MLGTILIVILILMLLGSVGTLPAWPHSRNWDTETSENEEGQVLLRSPPPLRGGRVGNTFKAMR